MTTRHAQPAFRARREHGVALVLVMIALLVGTTLAVSFLSQQTTATAVASNINAHSSARAVAESALVMAIEHVRTSSTWREDLANGAWATDVALQGGTYTVWGIDGWDENGDGVINGDETDGDLSDDANDLVTITVTATVNGVTHTVRAVMSPTEEALGPITVLMIVADPDNLTSAEETRQELIESWGWTVNLLEASADASEYAAAMAGAHVVYVPEDGGNDTVGAQLAQTALGVVFEDGSMMDELGMSTGSSTWNGNTVRIVDNSHYITSPFDIGDVTFAASAGKVEYPGGTVAGALRELGWRPDDDDALIISVIDAGKTLQNGSTAKGRRTVSPFNGFDADELNSDGQTLLKRMLEWQAMSALSTDAVDPITDWEEGTTIDAPEGDDRLLIVTVGAETHNTVTSISYGNVPLTIAASAYESTGVGARTYIYYLRETGIAAADDDVIRATWSGSADDKSYASRMYQYVNQTTPIRITNTQTNAGPESISTLPLEVTNGDVVIGSAQVGHPNSYSWVDPINMGVNDINSSSTHTAGDYQVIDDPGTVTVTATVSAPNRQALIGMVIQPRSQSSGEGVIPQVLALYEFAESQPTVELMGHWKLDDEGKGGTVALGANIDMSGSSLIDGYDSTDGGYGVSGNDGQAVTLATNTGDNGGIALDDNAVIIGDTYNEPGANPTEVVDLSGNSRITGNRYEQSVPFTLPTFSAPTGMPGSVGNLSINAPYILATDLHCDDLTIQNPAGVITVVGNRRIWVEDDFEMRNSASILLSPGASLTIYVGGDAVIRNTATLNPDTTRPDDVTLILYDNGDLSISNSAHATGTFHVEGDLDMANTAELFGSVYVHGDIDMANTAAIHIDQDLPAFHLVKVNDTIGTNDGLAQGEVEFNQSGATASTGTSLRFDGIEDFILIRHHDDYLLNHGAVSFWFYPESLTGTHAILSKDSAGYDTGGHLHVYTSGTTLYARLTTNGSSPYGTGDSFTVSEAGMSINTWTHVTLTFGAGGMRLYVNGALVDSSAYFGALAYSSGDIGNYEPLVLGAGTDTSGDLTHLPLNNFFKGRIDDVRIYKDVLDAGQVAKLYAGLSIGDRTEASYVVRDTSGLGDPLDLFVENTAAVNWEAGGGLTLNSGTILRAPEPAGTVFNGITATGEFTIEMTLEHASDDSNARRLMWFGASSGSNANLDIHTQGGSHVIRVRNADTTGNPPDIYSGDSIQTGTQHHVLTTFDGEYVRVYVDGIKTAEESQPGDLLSWSNAYDFTLANTPTGGSPWLGTLTRVAIYDRAMNQKQTDNLFSGLPPGDGASTSTGTGQVRWVEP